MAIKLKQYQLDAIEKLKNGSILCGDVGSGKSLTSIAYYFKDSGYDLKHIEKIIADEIERDYLGPNLKDLIIITTPQKRDKYEWDKELTRFGLCQRTSSDDIDNDIIIDSWNNIHKYSERNGAFFIFDEQRVIGNGAWVKNFLKISKNNNWILLSATPGDTYMDYLPVFIANGFFKNRTEFIYKHVIYNRFCKFPKIDKYVNTGYLDNLINKILVHMDYRHAVTYDIKELKCQYDKDKYDKVVKERWNPFEDKPITTASEFCKVLRIINNSDISRLQYIRELYNKHKKIIVFYNFNFELESLLSLKKEDILVSQWNGHKHEDIPFSDKWIHAVQYMSGNEGWNCIETDTIVFYSNNYSYRIMKQAAGRIDRMNSPFCTLYYYMLVTDSKIETSILSAIKDKKEFNEKNFSANFGV